MEDKNDGKEGDYIGIVLSVLLSAAIAHALNLLAVFIPESETFAWAIFTFIILLATIGIISALVEKSFIKDRLTFIKTTFIVFFTMFSFALARFFNFFSQEGKSSNLTSYFAILTLLGGLGLILIVWGLSEKQARRWVLIILGIVLFAIIGLLYFLYKPLGIGGRI